MAAQEQHLVILDVLGQPEVVKLRLPRLPVGLDEDLANPDILADVTKGLLHRLPGTQYGHTADLLDCAPGRSQEV